MLFLVRLQSFLSWLIGARVTNKEPVCIKGDGHFNHSFLARFFLSLSLVGISLGSIAQLWPGNVGPAILNKTFGSGRGIPLPAGTTSFSFAGGCPTDGRYTINHFLFGCGNNTWFLMVGDHTKDFEGNYMLVNGAGAPAGLVTVDTVRGLCANTTYQYSAFISNVMQNLACSGNPVLPDLSLTIESITGTVLANYNTGALPITAVKTWTEYGTYFTTSATPQDIVVKIRSNVTGACGAAFAIDDVTVKAAGPSIDITLDGQHTYFIDVCRGYTNPFILHSTYSAGYIDPVLQWQQSNDTGRTWLNIPGAMTDTYQIPLRDNGVILYRMMMAERTNSGNSRCGIITDSIWTSVHSRPDGEPLKNVLGCLNKDLTLVPPQTFLQYDWTGPNGFQSVSPRPVLPNLQYADSGMYIVVLTADFGCSVIDTLQVNISPSTTIQTETLYSICEGETIQLDATGDGTFAWTPSPGLSNASIGNPVVTPADSTAYKVVLTNSYGCKDSARVVINVYRNVIANAGPDKKILEGDTVSLNGSVKGTSVNYSWTPSSTLSNPSILQPTVFPESITTYTLNAASEVGCGISSSTVTVRVYKEVMMPNAFTPNGDGKNDVFHVFAFDSYQLVSFSIFNRWGARVFTSTNGSDGWDGKVNGQPQATGTYVYWVDMKHVSGKKIQKKGTIVLIR